MSDKQVQPTTLNEIDQATDTRDTLAHARAYAEKNGLNDTLVVDIDAHVTETAFWSEVTDRIPSPVYQQIAKSFAFSCLGWKHGSKWVFDFTGGLERQAATSLDAHVAQLVEHILGKDEVTSSNLVMGSTKNLFISKYNELTNKK